MRRADPADRQAIGACCFIVKLIKYSWPVIMAAALCFCCVRDWRRVLAENGDELDFSLLYFLLLTPACSLILSLWYGYILRSAYKWIIVLACGVGAAMLSAFSSGCYAFWEEWRLGIISLVCALVGMSIGSGLWKLGHRKNKKLTAQ